MNTGVKLCIATRTVGQPDRLALVQGPSDLVVVGVKDRARARFRRAGADVLVPRDDGSFAAADDGVGGVQGAVAVDDQAGVPLQHGVRAQRRPQALRDTRRADVPRDVAGELVLGQPERAQRTRNEPARVITDDEEGRAPIAALHVQRGDIVRGEQHEDIMTDWDLCDSCASGPSRRNNSAGGRLRSGPSDDWPA